MTDTPSGKRWDLFISHASEDKPDIAVPLFESLRSLGYQVWFDEATLKMGDRLSAKIDEGLARSRFGIVIVSPYFLKKSWPKTELSALQSRQHAEGSKIVLPIWHKVTRDAVADQSPQLADTVAIDSSVGLTAMVDKIVDIVGTPDIRKATSSSSYLPLDQAANASIEEFGIVSERVRTTGGRTGVRVEVNAEASEGVSWDELHERIFRAHGKPIALDVCDYMSSRTIYSQRRPKSLRSS